MLTPGLETDLRRFVLQELVRNGVLPLHASQLGRLSAEWETTPAETVAKIHSLQASVSYPDNFGLGYPDETIAWTHALRGTGLEGVISTNLGEILPTTNHE